MSWGATASERLPPREGLFAVEHQLGFVRLEALLRRAAAHVGLEAEALDVGAADLERPLHRVLDRPGALDGRAEARLALLRQPGGAPRETPEHRAVAGNDAAAELVHVLRAGLLDFL